MRNLMYVLYGPGETNQKIRGSVQTLLNVPDSDLEQGNLLILKEEGFLKAAAYISSDVKNFVLHSEDSLKSAVMDHLIRYFPALIS